MRLKDLERDIQMMEAAIKRAESLNQEVHKMEDQVNNVREDLIEELTHMNSNFREVLVR